MKTSDEIKVELRYTIFDIVDDLVTDFLYYDRKDDDEIGVEELDSAIKSGIITVEEIIAHFAKKLRHTYPNIK